MTQLSDLLRTLVERGGSDLHIRAGSPPLLRLGGELEALGTVLLTEEGARALSEEALTEEQRTRFERQRDLDFAWEMEGVGRFRGSLYRERGRTQSVFRAIPLSVRTLEDLRLPPVCRYFVERPRGLVLVTGPSGSGKSTTLAAFIDYINRHFALHVLTIEDPIEFVHEDHEALINQRELDRDTHSYAGALRAALRQDPNVLLVGELRDAETVGLALAAAEMGHLVFCALHTPDAAQTVDRLVDLFPAHQQQPIRMQLSTNLVGVVSQTLVRTKDGKGRVAAFETLVGVPTVRALIRDGKTHQIPALIGTGSKQGMMTLDQSLANLVKRGLVAYDDALAQAHNLTEFHFLCSDGQEAADPSHAGLDRNGGYARPATVPPPRPPAH